MPFWRCKKCDRSKYLGPFGKAQEDGICLDCKPNEATFAEWAEDGTNEDDMFRCPWCAYTFMDELHGFDGEQECPECEKPVYVELDYTTHVKTKRREEA